MANTKEPSDAEKLKIQNLAPEKASCKECGQELPGNAPTKKQESKKDEPVGSESCNNKMKHGQY